MSNEQIKTKRGVYIDLSQSPFLVKRGDNVYRFSSATKMQAYIRNVKTKSMQLESYFVRLYGQDFDRKATNFDNLIDVLFKTCYNQLKRK